MKTIIILMIIGMIGLVGAYYPGETIMIENEMGIENLVYTIVGNTYNVSELDMKINSTNIIITFPQDMIPDSFDIVFLENQTVVQTVTVTEHHYSSGNSGGSSTKYVDRNITTTEFIDREYGEREKEIVKVPGEIIIEEKVPVWVWVLGSLFLIVVVVGWVIVLKKEALHGIAIPHENGSNLHEKDLNKNGGKK